ncbi:MAG: DEAD/DEAH box helicase [Opitutales bacterium]|nr:DEAD/DEAH box helicase [Opitutales bacterium]
MELRPYQRDFCDAIIKDLGERQRLLGVLPTGAGKTLCCAEIIKRCNCPSLFLADARELVYQAAEKISTWTGIIPDIETGEAKACGNSQITVGTTQSMARRLDKYYPEDIGLVIVDEAHRNTLGSQALRVLNYFSGAKVVGITATPYRSDKKLLSSFYEKVSYEIGMFSLIAQGYLSKIIVKSVPVNIDLKSVRSHSGDYDENDLANAISPHLRQCATLLKEHAKNRKTVVFLPLINTSKLFCRHCNELGLKAVHVDGSDRASLGSDWRVICNSSLLSTGWDEPSVDCVYILRPTKSQTLFSQMVGRGTRIFPGKRDMLLIDPLFLTDDLNLIRPARLIAKDPEEAKFLQSRLDIEGGDLMAEAERAKKDRALSLQEELIATRQKSARTIDAMELALSLDRFDIVDYEPEFFWERQPMTDAQRSILEKSGFDIESPEMCKGLASKIIDLLFQRRELGLASPKQVRLLRRLGFKDVATISFDDAKRKISARLDGDSRHDK